MILGRPAGVGTRQATGGGIDPLLGGVDSRPVNVSIDGRKLKLVNQQKVENRPRNVNSKQTKRQKIKVVET